MKGMEVSQLIWLVVGVAFVALLLVVAFFYISGAMTITINAPS